MRVTLQFMPKLMLHDRACYFMSVKSLIFCQHHDTYLLRNRALFNVKYQNNLRDLPLWMYSSKISLFSTNCIEITLTELSQNYFYQLREILSSTQL